MHKYRNSSKSDNPPHIYAMANQVESIFEFQLENKYNSMTLLVEVQDKGFSSRKAKSPLQFEFIFYALRHSLTFRS